MTPGESPRGPDPSVSIEAKVAFLERVEAYPDTPRRVEVVETHMSWVFLTDRYVYKLKKPVRYEFLDFRSLAARRRDCEEEVRLNRRLAGDVYLGTVPVTLDSQGALRLGGDGEPVEWLVRMRRLPAAGMLDRAIRDHSVREGDVRKAAAMLAEFYRQAPALDLSPEQYRRRLARDVRANRAELSRPGFGLPAVRTQRVHAAQLDLLKRRPELFDARVREGRIIEAHGDLRPEHVCLQPQPVIIDCLEFKREFRILDPAEELSFLAMECQRLGAAFVGELFFEVYRRVTGDAPPPRLLGFYKSHRACLRAKLAIWHTREPEIRDPRKWSSLAHEYLQLAERLLPCEPAPGSSEP